MFFIGFVCLSVSENIYLFGFTSQVFCKSVWSLINNVAKLLIRLSSLFVSLFMRLVIDGVIIKGFVFGLSKKMRIVIEDRTVSSSWDKSSDETSAIPWFWIM